MRVIASVAIRPSVTSSSPETRARGDADDLVARGCQRVAGRGHRQRHDHDAEQGGDEAHACVGRQ